MMEDLKIVYVDVIIQRFEQMTRLYAVLLNG